MFKVFLGSTFKDLREHRAAVQAAINRRDDCKAVVMEEFGARVGRPKDVCLEIAAGCDLYVGLIGHCYGHVPDGEAVSITEAEYEAAVAKGLPRLLFVAGEDFLMPASIRESEAQRERQQSFRERLLACETAQWFANDRGTLAARVGEALSREIEQRKGGRAEEPAAVPVSLPKKGLCVGRDEEVALLCRAVLAEEPEPVVVLGPPGIGKSKVTIAALHDPEVRERFGDRRWFVPLETAPEHAAIPGQVALRVGVAPGPDLPARVLAHLAAGPALLVLDNTETPWWQDRAGAEAALEELAQAPGLALVCSVRGHRAPGRPRFGTTVLVPGLREPAARALFLARAGERHADSALLPGLLADMDGVPLAIELLAAQVRADERSLERVAAAWRAKRTELLASQPDAAHRLDSYVVSLALSLASPRMTGPARELYALMGRLPAGLSTGWTEVLMPGEGDAAAEILADLGLAFDAGGRLRMLAPVREHAADQPLGDAALDGLVRHWLTLARERAPRIGRAGGAEAAALLGAEWVNLESAFRLGVEQVPEQAIDAATSLAALVQFTGLGSEQMLLAAETVAGARGDDRSAAIVSERLGDIALRRSDHEAARQRYEAALALYRRIEEPYSIGRALVSLARLAEGAVRAGRVVEARAAWESIDRPDLIARLEHEFGAG